MLTQSFEQLYDAMPYLLGGAGVSVCVVICSLAIGFTFGVPFALAQVYGGSLIRRFVALYVWFFRGVPILVLLYLIYFGLAYQLGLDIKPFGAACIVLGLTSTAYQSQIFRGSLQSIPKGQLKAGLALGMSTSTAIKNILIPQMLRLSVPGWSNEFSILLKDSVLVSVIGTAELMVRAKHVAARTHDYALFYLAAGLLYFLITYIGIYFLRRIEKRFSLPGYVAN